ncbi:MAG: hypothetical protein AAB451_03135 [Patescibacteria group bacterium]
MLKKIIPQIIASLFLAGFVVYAWTGPAGTPPNNNVDAPINVGDTSQYKSGAFGLGGLFHAFSDAIFDGKVGIGTTNPQGQLDVGGGKFVVKTEGDFDSFDIFKNPNSVVDQTPPTGILWSNPLYAKTSDDSSAVASTIADSNGFASTHYLKAANFGFSIPSNAVIDGIEVEIERANTIVPSCSSPNLDYCNTKDLIVQLLNGGSLAGGNKATSEYWPQTDQIKSYGSSIDKWGVSWLPADINSSDFGIVLQAQIASWVPTIWSNAKVDSIRIKIYYSVPIGLLIDTARVGGVAVELEPKGFSFGARGVVGANNQGGWTSVVSVPFKKTLGLNKISLTGTIRINNFSGHNYLGDPILRLKAGSLVGSSVNTWQSGQSYNSSFPYPLPNSPSINISSLVYGQDYAVEVELNPFNSDDSITLYNIIFTME